MRKLVFILLFLFTGYLAGMYRYLPLLVLAGLEGCYFVASFFLSRYFCKNLSIKALQYSGFVEKSDVFPCNIKVENTGKLPISRFRVRIWYGYGSKPWQVVKHIYGGSEQGENILRFEVTGKYCGMMYLKMSRLYVYDYLSLFATSKKLQEEIKVAVFPHERALRLELSSLSCQQDYLPQEIYAGRGGENRSEVRQLREYHTEDSNRHIHWNQSARMGELWVKEYEKETDKMVTVFLELEGIWEFGASERDNFYELLSALMLGLLKKVAGVRVCWYDGWQKCLVEAVVADRVQYRDLLLSLYQTTQREWDESDCDLVADYFPKGCFKLGLDLGWYWNEVLIFQFSEEELENQIAHKTFAV